MRWMTIAATAGLVLAACTSSDVSRTIGARCDQSSECDDRCLAPSASYPGGMCTLSCDDDGACPGDTRCAGDDGGVCLYECGGDGDCSFLGQGWTCQERDGRPDGRVMVCRG
jgi:hypothetical protein